jgi:hypothetical protein
LPPRGRICSQQKIKTVHVAALRTRSGAAALIPLAGAAHLGADEMPLRCFCRRFGLRGAGCSCRHFQTSCQSAGHRRWSDSCSSTSCTRHKTRTRTPAPARQRTSRCATAAAVQPHPRTTRHGMRAISARMGRWACAASCMSCTHPRPPFALLPTPRRPSGCVGCAQSKTSASSVVWCLVYNPKGGTRRKNSRRTTSFGPTDVFVGIICGRTRQKRSLVANGFDY